MTLVRAWIGTQGRGDTREERSVGSWTDGKTGVDRRLASKNVRE